MTDKSIAIKIAQSQVRWKCKEIVFFQVIGRPERIPKPTPPPAQKELKLTDAQIKNKIKNFKKKKYKVRKVKRIVDTKLITMHHKEAPVTPDVKVPIIRPKAVYDNKSPYGIASELHK